MDTQEVEEELYAAEPFGSEKEFLKKAAFYQALVFIPVILDNLLVQYKDELAQWARVGPGGTMYLHVPISK